MHVIYIIILGIKIYTSYFSFYIKWSDDNIHNMPKM
jgi:hypothetical protein